MANINIYCDSIIDVDGVDGSSYDETDKWNRQNTDTIWYPNTMTVTMSDERIRNRDYLTSEPIDFDVSVGDTVYVVYGIYSTGDSFGYDYCQSMEIMGIFKTRSLAEALLQKVQVSEYDWKNEKDKTYLSESGKKMPIYIPWFGYFEYPERQDIQTCVVV